MFSFSDEINDKEKGLEERLIVSVKCFAVFSPSENIFSNDNKYKEIEIGKRILFCASLFIYLLLCKINKLSFEHVYHHLHIL